MYKAFISSTYEDLYLHRAEVIHTLQAAGFLIDPMENWQADREAPHKFSSERLNGCQICILLVAFRRGHIPDSSLRSITQIEYDEARRRNIDVLPFLLSEQSLVGNTCWNPKFDERKRDIEVNQWRKSLRQAHGVSEFDTDPKSVRIEASLARWVVQKESDKARRFRRNIVFSFFGIFLFSITSSLYVKYVYESPALLNEYHSRYLTFHDPIAFSYAINGQYSSARVLPDRAAFKDTNLSEEIGATQSTFDMLANNAQFIRVDHFESLRNIIKRGGRLRIILWDYSQANKSYDPFHDAIAEGTTGQRGSTEARAGGRMIHDVLEQLRRDVEVDRKTYLGSFEYRINPQMLFYTMWIRDWNEQGNMNALGHLGVHFYRGQQYWPSIRVSMRNGKELLNNMHKEFEHAWAKSQTINTLLTD